MKERTKRKKKREKETKIQSSLARSDDADNSVFANCSFASRPLAGDIFDGNYRPTEEEVEDRDDGARRETPDRFANGQRVSLSRARLDGRDNTIHSREWDCRERGSSVYESKY